MIGNVRKLLQKFWSGAKTSYRPFLASKLEWYYLFTMELEWYSLLSYGVGMILFDPIWLDCLLHWLKLLDALHWCSAHLKLTLHQQIEQIESVDRLVFPRVQWYTGVQLQLQLLQRSAKQMHGTLYTVHCTLYMWYTGVQSTTAATELLQLQRSAKTNAAIRCHQ